MFYLSIALFAFSCIKTIKVLIEVSKIHKFSIGVLDGIFYRMFWNDYTRVKDHNQTKLGWEPTISPSKICEATVEPVKWDVFVKYSQKSKFAREIKLVILLND